MALQTLFLEIYLAVLFINGGIYITSDALDIELISPFDQGNVTAVTQPNIFNATDNTGSISGNFTTLDSLSNSTINPSGTGNINPIDSLFFPITMLYTFVQFMTGSFLWQALLIFGFPVAFVFVMQGAIGLLLVITIVYYLTGR